MAEDISTFQNTDDSRNPSSIRATPDSEKNDNCASSAARSSRKKKDLKFWLIFVSMCICVFLSAMELLSVSTALPTITYALRASQFVWVGSAYTLSSTAFLPTSGGLAQAFGRRPAILIAIGLFALGSGICGGANTMDVLVAGRTVQGLGGGGIQSLTGIILADLVPLQQRGVYTGLFGLVYCIAASIGPVVGGSLAAHGYWRWLFFLNLPISFVTFLCVVCFLDLPTPSGNYRDKFKCMDWIGNFLVISSTVACTIGLTWGGTTAPWNSATVLVPIVIGLVGLVLFVVYEATLATHPLVPLVLIANVTSISGYVQTFCVALNMVTVIYFFPVYFQACKGFSPVSSGIYTLGLCAFAPATILVGLSVKATGRYRPQMWTAWTIVLVVMSLLSAPATNVSETGIGTSVGYLVLLGLGTGALYVTVMYPIQAPLSPTQNAPALAWMWFLRSFAGVWGITIGSTILQNELIKTLPASFRHSAPSVTSVYALIPELSGLPPHLRSEVQLAFERSLAVLWQFLAAVCAVGAVSSVFMKGLTLSPPAPSPDEAWALKQQCDARKSKRAEMAPFDERMRTRE